MKNYYIISDYDADRNQITGFLLNQEDDFFADTSLYLEITNRDVFSAVRDMIDRGATVLIPKNIEGILEIGDIDAIEYTPLKSEKIKAFSSASHAISNRYRAGFVVMDFYQMMLINNKLMESGYFITDENRESKYLEIINSGDVDLIADLEKYLEIWDRISSTNYFYKKFIKFQDHLNMASSIDEVKQLTSDFLAIFR